MKMLTAITVLMLIPMSGNSYTLCNAQRTSPVAVGEVAPNFTLEDQDGQRVTLSDARGKGPVVLVFYRGYW